MHSLDENAAGQPGHLPPVSPSAPSKNLMQSASEPALQCDPSRSLPKGSFLPRQFGHPSIAARRSLAQKRQALIRDTRSFEDLSFYGSQGALGFAAHLRTRFGSVLAGWRWLDDSKKGRLSFHPFCKAARKSGFHGNMKRLWDELCQGKTFVTLEDIDPHVWRTVSTFKEQLRRKYGDDLLLAWQQGLDQSGTGRATVEDLQTCLNDLGMEVNAKELLSMFVGPGMTCMTLADFDPKAYVRWQTEPSTPIGDQAANTAEARTDRTRLGVSTKEALIDTLISRFGSVFRAWREVLDPLGRGRLSWGEFTHVFRRLGLHGDLQGLWAELDVEQLGIFRLSDLDEEYGNMLKAWIKGIDVDGKGYIDQDRFVEACKQVGFLKNADALFELMRPPGERSFMTLQDFDFKAYQAFMRNDFRMLDETKQSLGPMSTASPLEISLQERTERGFFFQIRRGWNLSKSAEFEKHCKVYIPPKQEDVHIEQFADLCSRKYGSMVAAWRFGIDPKGRGQLNFNEFCTAVRRLGYRGSLRKLWVDICPDGCYVIRLKDLDFESGDAVTLFFETIHERFEDLATVWSEVFHKDAYSSVDLEELRKGCQVLGLPADFVEKLFVGLNPMPGQKDALFLWDLEDLFVTTRRLWERKRPKHLRRSVKPVGTSLIVAKEANEARLNAQKEAEIEEAGEKMITNHTVTPQLARHALARDFVSTVACWSSELDWRGKGNITRGQFLAVMYRCGICGNLQKLWNDFTGDRGVMTFNDLDPTAQRFINECRGQLLSTYGTLGKAWHEGFDPGDLGIVDITDFTTACKSALPTLKANQVQTLFHYLLARHGQR
ncbi:unnamed protein product, partial [Durusdinium trenchii]